MLIWALIFIILGIVFDMIWFYIAAIAAIIAAGVSITIGLIKLINL